MCFTNQYLWFGTAKSYIFPKFSFFLFSPLWFSFPSPNPLKLNNIQALKPKVLDHQLLEKPKLKVLRENGVTLFDPLCADPIAPNIMYVEERELFICDTRHMIQDTRQYTRHKTYVTNNNHDDCEITFKNARSFIL